jgi:hypothetical protein
MVFISFSLASYHMGTYAKSLDPQADTQAIKSRCKIQGKINPENSRLCEALVCKLGRLWSSIEKIPSGKNLAQKAAEQCGCACAQKGHPKAFQALSKYMK